MEWASFYGPGLYYSETKRLTADGTKLTPTTIGVAHKTLPLGLYGKRQPTTYVRLTWGQRSIVLPVIDRGPYVAGRDWDLTIAAARKFGMISAGVVPVTSEIVTSAGALVEGPHGQAPDSFSKSKTSWLSDMGATADRLNAAHESMRSDSAGELGASWGLSVRRIASMALVVLLAYGLYSAEPGAAIALLWLILIASLIFNIEKLSRNFR